MRAVARLQGASRRAIFRRRLRLIPSLVAIGLLATGCTLYNTIFPSSDHDELAPEIPADLAGPAVLVFSKTNGFRHEEAIAAGVPVFEAIAKQRGFGLFATENGAVHTPELLARFDVVVWFNVSGDVLDEDQREALLDWIRGGGGFFGIHGTGGDASYEWKEHPQTLVGAQFIGHPMGPQFQQATVRIEATQHPVVRHLGDTWIRNDEWYSFEQSPRGPGYEVLATLDESSYSPRMKIAFFDRDLAMGDDHPIIWTHCIGRGRALYSALGHQAAAYAEAEHVELLSEGIVWLMASRRDGCAIAGP